MEHKITDRQLVALLGVYLGQGPYAHPHGVYGEAHEKAGQVVWCGSTNMGGAIRRMVETLQGEGYLSGGDRHNEFTDRYANRMTAKGYAALRERLHKLPTVKDWSMDTPYQFVIDPAEVDARMAERVQQEADWTKAEKAHREEARRQLAEHADRYRAEKLIKLRALFAEHGLADNWSDDQLLAFADRVASI